MNIFVILLLGWRSLVWMFLAWLVLIPVVGVWWAIPLAWLIVNFVDAAKDDWRRNKQD